MESCFRAGGPGLWVFQIIGTVAGLGICEGQAWTVAVEGFGVRFFSTFGLTVSAAKVLGLLAFWAEVCQSAAAARSFRFLRKSFAHVQQ